MLPIFTSWLPIARAVAKKQIKLNMEIKSKYYFKSMSTPIHHAGRIAIIGRPNVGKSTLINKLLGKKISITCRKPQTTRHQILGIKTLEDVQYVYVDTPGIHKNLSRRAMNQYMNRTARQAYVDESVDVILFLIDSTFWTEEEDAIVQDFKKIFSVCPEKNSEKNSENHTEPSQKKPSIFLIINKIDTLRHHPELLPLMASLSKKYGFAEIIPISAKQGHHLENLEGTIKKYLPEQDFLYPIDQLTDRPDEFLCAEIIREKLIRTLGDELPYDISLEINLFEEKLKEKGEGTLMEIHATIYVARSSQKAIIIGKQGEKLKEVGRQARLDLKKLLNQKVFLQLWVKVKTGWAEDARALKSLGYE